MPRIARANSHGSDMAAPPGVEARPPPDAARSAAAHVRDSRVRLQHCSRERRWTCLRYAWLLALLGDPNREVQHRAGREVPLDLRRQVPIS